MLQLNHGSAHLSQLAHFCPVVNPTQDFLVYLTGRFNSKVQYMQSITTREFIDYVICVRCNEISKCKEVHLPDPFSFFFIRSGWPVIPLDPVSKLMSLCSCIYYSKQVTYVAIPC